MPKYPAGTLSPKQSRFVSEYVAHGNAARAAITAGYSAKTARAIACENLKKPDVRAEIERQRGAREQKHARLAYRAIEELKRIGFSSLGGVFDGKGGILDPQEWPREAKDAVRYLKIRRSPPTQKGGSETITYTIRAHDKVRALATLLELVEPN